MASNQLVQTRIDGAIKEEAAVVLAAIGLTVSDAVRMLLTRVAQEKALPFELMIPNVTTIQAMKDARAGKVTKAANLTALFDDLNADTWLHQPVQAGLQARFGSYLPKTRCRFVAIGSPRVSQRTGAVRRALKK